MYQYYDMLNQSLFGARFFTGYLLQMDDENNSFFCFFGACMVEV